MKKSRFTEEQIVFALKQVELVAPVPEVCRKLGVQTPRFTRGGRSTAGFRPQS